VTIGCLWGMTKIEAIKGMMEWSPYKMVEWRQDENGEMMLGWKWKNEFKMDENGGMKPRQK